MSLTGNMLFVSTIMMAVAAIACTLFGWNRFGRPGIARWLARVGMIVGCQLTAVALVAIRINDDNGLYSSWSDLFDSDTSAPATLAADPTARFHDTDQEGVLGVDYHGPQSGLTGEILVWTPPQYRDLAYRDYRFPVIMLLHGVPGTPWAWVRGGDAPNALGAMMGDGRLTPAVLVMPRVDPQHRNTDCTDIPGGPRTATWLSADVPHLIEDEFRVSRKPTRWAVVGESTGGYCAAKLPLQHPDSFGVGAAISPDDFAGDASVIASPELRHANNPVTLAAGGAPVSILVATSRRDRFSSEANALALHNAAQPPTLVPPPLIVADGGHNWGSWQALYPAIFGWISPQIKPTEPDEGLDSRTDIQSVATRLPRPGIGPN